ncbi:type II toxin-antitoxin system VapC family toxin [Nocardioides pelophilus]|uniref:type II toxin-antitoxin system VapC family toxin n=1 Tax=Nocardioides pelophilus TaxID=2172019 RepID=UPI001602EAC2|nr:type II toxin-antitoxin system VapC family toxin [Nocardioides pelophilus]
MIILDTNVWSEPLRERPDPHVLEWVESNAASAALTAVTIAELQYGVARLPTGRRRSGLETAVTELIVSVGDAALPFDAPAATEYAAIRAQREAMGRPISVEDGMIAGIARAHGAAVATRNVSGFEGVDLTLVNPWTD